MDRFGRQKRETKQKQTNKTKNKEKINTGNNSTYHELLSEEWIGRRF